MKVALVWAPPVKGEPIARIVNVPRHVIPEVGDKVYHEGVEYVVTSRTWDLVNQTLVLEVN